MGVRRAVRRHSAAPRVPRAGLVGALVLPVVLAVAVAVPARADVPAGGRVSGAPERVLRDARQVAVGVVSAQATTVARQRAARAYWTRSRMLAARPVGLRVGADGRTVAVAQQASGRHARGTAPTSVVRRLSPARAPVVTGAAWPLPASPVARTTGKVFFTMNGWDYVCSGSAVSSPDASTVLTAGHCVNEGGDGVTPGAYATHLVFVPGYRDGTAPYGTFAATHLVTTSGWRTGGDFDVDVAFANVGHDGAGRTLTQAVGGQPIAFHRPRGGAVTVLGYPAAAPYTGERLTYCAGPLRQDSIGLGPDQGLRCDLTPGSSGGPWLADFDPVLGAGSLVSVTSFSYTQHPGILWGPYLGATAQSLYTAVAGTTSA